MIKLSQIKLPISHTDEELNVEVCRILHIPREHLKTVTLLKKSIDARKESLKYVYSLAVDVKEEQKLFNKKRKIPLVVYKKTTYHFPENRDLNCPVMKKRPIIVGSGPAGLFCAYFLAKAGYAPIVIERGDEVEKRMQKTAEFWENGLLDSDSNVQFGEGGAGTFSDGKLNSVVKDSVGRMQQVLELFVQNGAPEEILYQSKPHIGTDLLCTIVKNMRNEIIQLGGTFQFRTKLQDFKITDGRIVEAVISKDQVIPCETLILAIGHSARDTFELLSRKQLLLAAKAFAIGLRIEHPQNIIGQSQYGADYVKLPAADYKLTYQSENGRGVYSFCMCPGGFVVNASSEQGHIAINGMSNQRRDERNANSAIVVTITPQDFESQQPLAGIAFQRKWEQMAYQQGKASIPVQLFGDYKENKKSIGYGQVTSNSKGKTQFANLRECLPSAVSDSIIEGIKAFEHKICGFSMPEAVLSGVETRTSSPVRIIRNDFFESNISGIYPCGEGAGYAGGITSAAIDGIKIAEAVASKYRPMK